ncbi:hypothetical protein AAHE18_19G237100 [Arachis hypogaea]|uniref:Ubiquitin-like domain-containing protein n=1 Tax=Arachis hypogaea TaxID=3818 RepID=A0A444XUK8_ARAHY|nr:hypothetical protein Ahy_B09g099743 [Arachis hypogaea]
MKPTPLFMEVDLKCTVLKFKERLQTLLTLPISDQHLLFKMQILEDDQVLESYGIAEHSRIHVIFALVPSSVYANMVVKVRGGSSSTTDPAAETYSVVVSSKNIPSFKFNVRVTAGGMLRKLSENLQNFRENITPVVKDGCHILHHGRVMERDKSMEWQQVELGDKIEIIPRATD